VPDDRLPPDANVLRIALARRRLGSRLETGRRRRVNLDVTFVEAGRREGVVRKNSGGRRRAPDARVLERHLRAEGAALGAEAEARSLHDGPRIFGVEAIRAAHVDRVAPILAAGAHFERRPQIEITD